MGFAVSRITWLAPWPRSISKNLMVSEGEDHQGEESRRVFGERPSYAKVWRQVKCSQRRLRRSSYTK